MSEQWLWNNQTNIIGPITTEELAKLVTQNRIADDDHLRLVRSEEWIKGKEVVDSFRIKQSASDAANSAIANIAELRLHASADSPTRRANPDRVIFEVISGIGRTIAGSFGTLGAVFRQIEVMLATQKLNTALRWATKWKLPTLLAVMLLLAVLSSRFDFGDRYNNQVYDKLLSIREHLGNPAAKNESNATPPGFLNQSIDSLNTIIGNLDRKSQRFPLSRNYQTEWEQRTARCRLSLYSAACNLKQLMVEGQINPARDAEFTNCMEAVAKIRRGDGEAAHTSPPAIRRPRQLLSVTDSLTHSVSIIVVSELFLFIGCAAIVMYWRRRRHGI